MCKASSAGKTSVGVAAMIGLVSAAVAIRVRKEGY